MSDAPASSATKKTGRIADATVDPVFIDRWSPVAFSEHPLDQSEIDSLFEAARWAPSSFNEQPWLFIYSASAEDLARFRPLLADKNRSWADKAPLLIFVFAKRHFEHNGRENPCAAFDAGAAAMSLSLQAVRLGLHTHAMAGINRESVYSELGVPEGSYQAICAVVVGRHDAEAVIPEELSHHATPSDRKPRRTFAHPSRFQNP